MNLIQRREPRTARTADDLSYEAIGKDFAKMCPKCQARMLESMFSALLSEYPGQVSTLIVQRLALELGETTLDVMHEVVGFAGKQHRN